MEHLNYLAVIVAALIPMIVGALWYSPALFAKRWLALMGKTDEEVRRGGAGKAYALSFVASLVMSFVLAHFIHYTFAYTQASGGLGGFKIAFWAWLGFVITTGSSSVLFEGRRSGLYFLSMGYYLVSMLLMGLVLGAWR